MTSKSCFGFSGVGVSHVIGLCSFVGFFGGFSSLDMSSLKVSCLSINSKCHFFASPILRFIHSLQEGGNKQSSFNKTWRKWLGIKQRHMMLECGLSGGALRIGKYVSHIPISGKVNRTMTLLQKVAIMWPISGVVNHLSTGAIPFYLLEGVNHSRFF